ncbi:hypothetical protein AB1Y20_000606 [Prymnesium parvum]|uniref:Uncharacterized protein n=1 Tax=Prymnesium parvum TaxID=97485 RepID=A0AB34K5V6_PRYPA
MYSVISPKPGETIKVQYGGKPMKAVMLKEQENMKYRVVVDNGPDFGQLWTTIDPAAVIEIDRSVPRLNEEQMKTHLHGFQ